MYSHVISLKLPTFNQPEEMENVFSLNDMEKEIGLEKMNEVIDSIKSINQLTRVDLENDSAEHLEGSHTAQVLSMSASNITKNTIARPEFIQTVISVFFMEDYFPSIREEVLKLDLTRH